MKREFEEEFDKWYDSQFDGEWYKDYREELYQVWSGILWNSNIYTCDMALVFTTIVNAIKDQYGD